VTGISGNFFLDPESGEEVMMNSARYLRCQTILAAAAQSGRKVAMVTAKDKLRDLLTGDLQGIAFSAERAGEQIGDLRGLGHLAEEVKVSSPDIYSAEASLFVLRAGVALLESRRADFLYLSLTDYVQHQYPPAAPESLDFYEAIDRQLGRLLELGAVVGATADHGMNAKTRSDGHPNVIYMESELSECFGRGVRVICPITDPYVVHHGALGSAVTIYLGEGVSEKRVSRWLAQRRGVTEVWTRAEAATGLELPPDRIGDLTVFSDRRVVMGRTPEYHDLHQLRSGLRSHGGRFEERVPLLLSEPGSQAGTTRDPRNFDIFSYICTGGS
jgi:phosphonoacetate hydrolase